MMYFETLDALEELDSDSIAAILFAMRDYSQYGVIPDFPKGDTKSVLWKLIKRKLDADAERYEEIREQRIAAGRIGGLTKSSNAKQIQANEANDTFAKQINPTTTQQYLQHQHSKPSTNKGYKGDKERQGTVNRPYTPQPSLDDMDKLLEEVE